MSTPPLIMGTWIWHPEWNEGAVEQEQSAGAFAYFRRNIHLKSLPSHPLWIDITADTKYKLYVNARLISIGPVKGDEHLWFYDQVNIQPYLRVGENHFHVRVLRLYHATPFAASFSRLPYAGLFIRGNGSLLGIDTGKEWETAIDLSTRLPTDIEEDAFLHLYEDVDDRKNAHLKWLAAKELKFEASHGLSAPWKLSPKMIPNAKLESSNFTAIHNIRSSEPRSSWEKALLSLHSTGINLPAGTSHHLELEAAHHITAFLDFKFVRPQCPGSSLKVTYSECYEDQPKAIPWVRCKGDRRDSSKLLIGPRDEYTFRGKERGQKTVQLHENMREDEIFSPFHFRTLRFIALDIAVSKDCDLAMNAISITTTNYPLEILAKFKTPNTQNPTSDLWNTSILTLQNCMHDCYEDCPFYEQLQYAMDIRSSALFTYSISSDDRMARQAMIQLHNSYKTNIGLTASRAPAHQHQIIPHFSLYWICMITDHFQYFGDGPFVRQFLAACDGVFESFARRIDPDVELVRSLDATTAASQWDFVDWTAEWKPFGIPPAGEQTGFLSYTNMLYAYTLKRAAKMLSSIGRQAQASEYLSRADRVVSAIITHCFDGHVFTDGLSSTSNPNQDHSQHAQVWAVLCGAAVGEQASQILRISQSSSKFTPTSISMSFYTLRALSLAGGTLYNDSFHEFWNPWRAQLAQGLTTWQEDAVSQRSDCHAWGSAPIYEFLAEVVGIRPRDGGGITFEPRVALFPEMEAKVPIFVNKKRGVACVEWKRENEIVMVELELRFDGGPVSGVSVQAFDTLRENFSKAVFYIK